MVSLRHRTSKSKLKSSNLKNNRSQNERKLKEELKKKCGTYIRPQSVGKLLPMSN